MPVDEIKTIVIQTGTPGRPGLSAYQVAVNDGFVGTEAAWVASLTGAAAAAQAAAVQRANHTGMQGQSTVTNLVTDLAAKETPAGAQAKVDVEAAARVAGDAERVTLTAAAKNPDLLIVGAITRNANDVITSAAVVWPDGAPGTFTTVTIDASNAINGYTITYGSPVTRTFTQPTITRNANGAATTVPAIVVS